MDQFLCTETRRAKVDEMHPEVCFRALNKRQAMNFKKRSTEGFEERLAVLARYYPNSRAIVEMAMQQHRRGEVARDDIVDALVGAVTARNGKSLARFPDTPESDETGLPMEIVYWEP